MGQAQAPPSPLSGAALSPRQPLQLQGKSAESSSFTLLLLSRISRVTVHTLMFILSPAGFFYQGCPHLCKMLLRKIRAAPAFELKILLCSY